MSVARGAAGCHVDLIVIGAGSAGFAAAIRAADLGASVALVGAGTLGGTCVNVGCIPSKTLIRATEAVHAARQSHRFAGIRGEAQVASWESVVEQKDALVSSLRHSKYAALLAAYDRIAYMEGNVTLEPAGARVGGRSLRAPKTIIATGAQPAGIVLPGIEHVAHLTSTTALALRELPPSLLVIGGGYVGVELAQLFARAGVTVTLACRSRVLPAAEPEISAALANYLREEGIDVREGLTYRQIRATGRGIGLDALAEHAPVLLEAASVLLATGRRANSDGLGLADLGVELHGDGSVLVDDYMRTTRPGVYAAGDVTGRDPFVYTAAYGGGIAAENALRGDTSIYDATALPTVVFSDPQVASAGETEAQALSRGARVRTSIVPLDQVPRALAARDTRGLIKLVADAESERLLGAHVLAPEGADTIQTAVLAIRQRLTVSELASTLFPYLTSVEGLKLAALGFRKDLSKLSCCAG